MDQVRVHVHIECRDGLASDDVAEYVKTLTTSMKANVSRRKLMRKLCNWVENEHLFHENSTPVAASIRHAMQVGVVQPAPKHSYLAVAGSDKPELRVAVDHELLLGDVHMAIGRLNISTALEPGGAACPAYTFSQSSSSLQTNVPVIQIECTHANLSFVINMRVFPRRVDTAFSQCFEQVGDVSTLCEQHCRLANTQLAVKTRSLSHRNYRVACQATHRSNLLAMGLEDHTSVFADHKVLDRTTSLLSSTHETRGQAHSVHTVFFH